MANSIVKLTLESNQYERNLQQAKKSLEDFTSRIGVNMKSLSGMAMAAGAVTTALKVAKDAFKNSETSLDEWGRTVEAAKSIYSGFLTALNNSDISGFLGRMDDIVSAAREAYNAMDELGTFSAYNQRNVAKGRAGYQKALDEYKLNPTSENKRTLEAAHQKVLNDLKDSHDKTENAYQSALQKIAAERISSKELQDAFVKTFSEGTFEDLQVAKSSFSTGIGLNAGAQYYYGDRVYDGRIQDRSTGKWRDMNDTEKQQFEFARALSQVNDSQIKEVQALGARSIAITEQIYQQDRTYNRLAGNNFKKSTNGGGGGRIKKQPKTIDFESSVLAQAQMASAKFGAIGMSKMLEPEGPSQAWEAYASSMASAFEKPLSPLQKLEEELKTLREEVENPPDAESYQLGLSLIAEKEKEIAKFKGETKTEDIAKDTEDAWKGAANAMASVGSAMASIEDPTAKTVGIVMQAIATVAQAFSQALSEDKTTTGNIWAFIAAALASTASMVSVISSIHSATGYAQGGIVTGNSYSGDQIPIRANAGEVVLTRAMAGNLASQLEGNGLGNLNLSASVSAEQIRFVLNSNGRRTGRGEFVQTNSK